MDHRRYMELLKLDDAEIRSRREFYELSDDDLARLARLRPIAEAHSEQINEAFYDLLLSHPETRKFFPDDATVRRVKKLQLQYFLGLFAGRCDRAYVEDRLRVGAAHERIGLAPKWYIGAYRRYLELLRDRFDADLPPEESRAAYRSVARIVAFDMALAIDTYISANLETIGRHQTAIRELSTPVIRVYDRVLLMPLVGTVDSVRANQIMETVLSKIVEEQAKVIILDIAGVPVVDTRVADNLIKTSSAVKLLGAEAIVTGISAPIARTIVTLGIGAIAMHTRARLQDGIELALELTGRAIVAKGASA